MRILVANLGSTSFKYQVLDSDKGFEVTHRGSYERIGQATGTFANHGEVIDVILRELPQPPDAIGFKAVHGGPISGGGEGGPQGPRHHAAVRRRRAGP